MLGISSQQKGPAPLDLRAKKTKTGTYTQDQLGNSRGGHFYVWLGMSPKLCLQIYLSMRCFFKSLLMGRVRSSPFFATLQKLSRTSSLHSTAQCNMRCLEDLGFESHGMRTAIRCSLMVLPDLNLNSCGHSENK